MQIILIITLITSEEKYPIVPPIMRATSKSIIIHIRILIPLPPILQAFEKRAVDTSRPELNRIRIKRPH